MYLANLFVPPPPAPAVNHPIIACRDVSYKDKLTGVPPHDSVIWIKVFEHICDLKSVTEDAQQLGFVSLPLTGKAKLWLDALNDDDKDTYVKA